MMQVMPMPCCGVEPPPYTCEWNTRDPQEPFKVTCDDSNRPEGEEKGVINVDVIMPTVTIIETTDYSGFGWDPETGMCRACGKPMETP